MTKFITTRTVLSIVILLMSIPSQSQVIQTNAKNKTVDYEKSAKINGLVNE